MAGGNELRGFLRRWLPPATRDWAEQSAAGIIYSEILTDEVGGEFLDIERAVQPRVQRFRIDEQA